MEHIIGKVVGGRANQVRRGYLKVVSILPLEVVDTTSSAQSIEGGAGLWQEVVQLLKQES